MTRAHIVACARSLLGTPFQHQGRAPGVGLDCAGLLVCIARELGLSDYDQSGYGRQPANGLLEAALDASLTRRPLDAMQPGMVALIRFHEEPQHVGVLADYVWGDLSLIHAYSAVRAGRERGRVTEHRLDAAWRARIVAVYDFPGID